MEFLHFHGEIYIYIYIHLQNGIHFPSSDLSRKPSKALESCGKLVWAVIRQGIRKSDSQIGNLAQGILCTHVGHDIRRWPNLLTSVVFFLQRKNGLTFFKTETSWGWNKRWQDGFLGVKSMAQKRSCLQEVKRMSVNEEKRIVWKLSLRFFLVELGENSLHQLPQHKAPASLSLEDWLFLGKFQFKTFFRAPEEIQNHQRQRLCCSEENNYF